MKNVTKSSAVRVDEGGGGQRREENVLKSMQECYDLYDLIIFIVSIRLIIIADHCCCAIIL